MWLTTRAEGLDDPRHSKRGPFLSMNELVGGSLRLGLVLELGSLVGLYLLYWASGGGSFLAWNLADLNELTRASESFQAVLLTLSGLYLVGAIVLMFFQIGIADDTCWSRGYRSGTKILRFSVFFDVLASAFGFLFYFYVYKYYSQKWYSHFLGGGSEWHFFTLTRILRAFANAAYALAFYLLEVYHDEGAGDTHGYLNAALYALAAVAEFTVVGGMGDKAGPFFQLLALLASTVWAVFFEPEVNYVSPALHETELTNEVEQQVERFARMSPEYANPPEEHMAMGQ